MTTPDGGPAFPCEVGNGAHPNEHQTGPHTAIQYGMALRDFLAATVEIPCDGEGKLLGFLDKNIAKFVGLPPAPSDPAEHVHWNITLLAKLRYRLADAMLIARNQQPTDQGG